MSAQAIHERCSECGRKPWQRSTPSIMAGKFGSQWVPGPWVNHGRHCSRYGCAPDAPAATAQATDTEET